MTYEKLADHYERMNGILSQNGGEWYLGQDHAERSYDAEAVTRFLGKVSPVHLFWGGLDIAVTRFSGRPAPLHPGGIPALPDEITQEAYSHEVSSAGFWPGGAGTNFPARWLVGIGVDDPAWDHSTFSKNRDRLLEGDIAAKFLEAVLAQPRVRRLLSTDSFAVDGTLIEAWASMKSFKPTDGSDPPPHDGGRNGETDFHGHKRSNATHASTTDPEARLYRKGAGKEARPCFIGHALMENRSGLLVDGCVTPADGHAERVAALHMIEPRTDRHRAITLGADKGYDAEDFVNELRSMRVTPHVARNTRGRRSAIDGRTTRHAGYAASQRIRKRIEEPFGWIKTVAGQDKTRFRGTARVGFAFTFAAADYKLVRLPKLLAQAPT